MKLTSAALAADKKVLEAQKKLDKARDDLFEFMNSPPTTGAATYLKKLKSLRAKSISAIESYKKISQKADIAFRKAMAGRK